MSDNKIFRIKKEISRIIKNNINNDIELFLKINGLRILGFHIKNTEKLFLLRFFLSFSVFVFSIIIGFLINKNPFIFSALIGIFLYFFPQKFIERRMKQLREKIFQEIPDFLDIMSSLMKAGLNQNEVINYIVKNFDGEISGLFKIANTKIFEGESRSETFLEISRFSFNDDFKSIINILLQSEIIGNPISKILKDLSIVVRNKQKDLIKMKAEKLESNLMIVIFIFMFIPMLMIFILPVLTQLKLFFI